MSLLGFGGIGALYIVMSHSCLMRVLTGSLSMTCDVMHLCICSFVSVYFFEEILFIFHLFLNYGFFPMAFFLLFH